MKKSHRKYWERIASIGMPGRRGLKRAAIVIIAAIIVFLTASVLEARTYYVSTNADENHSAIKAETVRSIQKAADVARAGDTVLVGAGVYHGRVVLRYSGEP